MSISISMGLWKSFLLKAKEGVGVGFGLESCLEGDAILASFSSCDSSP